MKNKLVIFTGFNVLLWFVFKFQYSLKLDMLLGPEGPSLIAPFILLYLVFIVPVITLGVLIYCIYKLFKKRLVKEYIVATIINATFLLMIGLTLRKYI